SFGAVFTLRSSLIQTRPPSSSHRRRRANAPSPTSPTPTTPGAGTSVPCTRYTRRCQSVPGRPKPTSHGCSLIRHARSPKSSTTFSAHDDSASVVSVRSASQYVTPSFSTRSPLNSSCIGGAHSNGGVTPLPLVVSSTAPGRSEEHTSELQSRENL